MLTKEFHILIEDSRNPHINSRAAPKQKGSLKRHQLLQLKDYNGGTCRESPTTKHFSLSQQTRILVRERNHVYLLPFVEFFSGVLRFIIVTCSLANKIKFSNRFHWNKPSLNSTCFHFKKWSFPAKTVTEINLF
jgi:hypothetical protein